jgi:hypothetical protein
MGLNKVQLIASTGVSAGSYDPGAFTVGPDGRLTLAAESENVAIGPARQSLSYTSLSLASGALLDFTMPLGKMSNLLTLTLSHPAWIRFYRSAAQRSADIRLSPGGTLQSMIDLADVKPYGECVTTTIPQTIVQNPVPILVGDSSGLVYIRLVNYHFSAAVITVTTVSLPLEV